MSKNNKTKYAILGALSIKPCSGYDIKKFCDQSLSHFWNENFGHIYPVLRQMEAEGTIAKKTEYSGGRPPRNVYQIQDKGREELNKWLLMPVDADCPVRLELLLKMSFSVSIPIENVIQKIEKEKEKVIERLEKYLIHEKGIMNEKRIQDEQSLQLWLATIRYGISEARSRIVWCDDTIKSFSALKESK